MNILCTLFSERQCHRTVRSNGSNSTPFLSAKQSVEDNVSQ